MTGDQAGLDATQTEIYRGLFGAGAISLKTNYGPSLGPYLVVL